MTTIRRRVAAISEAHNRNGFQTPTQEWIVKNTMKRLWREHGSPARGKDPILVDDIKKIVAHCDTSTVSGIRDKAILLLGFASSLRRSDIVNIDIEDVSRAKEGLVIQVRKGKTDQMRKGRKIGIPYGKYAESCPVIAVFEWLIASGLSEGPLFRSMTKNEKPRATRMSAQVVALIVKKYCSLIGKKTSKFAAHSLRSGFVTSAAIAGVTERHIQNQSGHLSSTMLRRYIREAKVFRENAFKSLDL